MKLVRVWQNVSLETQERILLDGNGENRGHSVLLHCDHCMASRLRNVNLNNLEVFIKILLCTFYSVIWVNVIIWVKFPEEWGHSRHALGVAGSKQSFHVFCILWTTRSLWDGFSHQEISKTEELVSFGRQMRQDLNINNMSVWMEWNKMQQMEVNNFF